MTDHEIRERLGWVSGLLQGAADALELAEHLPDLPDLPTSTTDFQAGDGGESLPILTEPEILPSFIEPELPLPDLAAAPGSTLPTPDDAGSPEAGQAAPTGAGSDSESPEMPRVASATAPRVDLPFPQLSEPPLSVDWTTLSRDASTEAGHLPSAPGSSSSLLPELPTFLPSSAPEVSGLASALAEPPGDAPAAHFGTGLPAEAALAELYDAETHDGADNPLGELTRAMQEVATEIKGLRADLKKQAEPARPGPQPDGSFVPSLGQRAAPSAAAPAPAPLPQTPPRSNVPSLHSGAPLATDAARLRSLFGRG